PLTEFCTPQFTPSLTLLRICPVGFPPAAHTPASGLLAPATANKPKEFPTVRDVQLFPPLLVVLIIPPEPTAQASEEVKPTIPFTSFDMPNGFDVHVEPLLVVMSTVPLLPDTHPSVADKNATEYRLLPVPE